MKSKLSSLWFNSTIAFVLAGITATTLHELSHLLTGKALGEQTTLFATAVDYAGRVSESHQIMTAVAGPVFSLLFGLLLIKCAKNWGTGFVRLFWMWLGFMSAQIGFGYFTIALFARIGDTGKVLDLLDAPSIIYWISMLVGIAGTLWLSMLFARRAVAYTDGSDTQLRSFGIFSWLAGSGLLIAAYLATVRNLESDAQFICLLGIFASGIFAPMFSFFYKKVKTEHEQLSFKTPTVGIVITVVAVVILNTVLASGVSL